MNNKTPVRDITELLQGWNDGDSRAMERLAPIVYDELHRLAHNYMSGERDGHTLQTSALVNEAYIRLVDIKEMQWENRQHFFAMTGRLMRRILVDFARRRRNLKRGGGAEHVSFEEGLTVSPSQMPDLLAIDEALDALAAEDPRKVRVVELRFFAGLDTKQTAAALNVSPETVRRDWRLARAWLHRQITQS